MAISTVPCEVCSRPTVHRETYEKWGHAILACQVCGLGTTRVESDFSGNEIYDESYYQGGRRDGYADYANSREVLKHEFRRTLARMRSLGPAHGQLLEVGCAFGYFLDEALEFYECHGVEVSGPAVEKCRARGLRVHHGEVEPELLRRIGTVDAVVMLDCIEHLPNPAEVVALLSASLRRGGSLIVTTGDWLSPLARVLGRRWRLMTPPQHRYFFSKKNLSQLLERQGFEVLDCTRPWKWVPLGLIVYQIARRLGLQWDLPRVSHSMKVPVNLFDTILIVGRKS